ncbi:hypothetical protein [Streptomyces vastus]|uniref:hypothetical protein n=1 Tax=Streptomyces vastus TaxID=285451 RepID=UPI0031CE0939
MNARLRQVVADKDELIASQDTLIRLQRDQLAGQDELLVEQARLIALVEEQNAALRRQVGLDSKSPPSARPAASVWIRRPLVRGSPRSSSGTSRR